MSGPAAQGLRGKWPWHTLLQFLRCNFRAFLLALSRRLATLALALPVSSAEEAISTRETISQIRELLTAENTAAHSLCVLDGCDPKPVRIFIDGVFDLTHYGHMNAFRQARALGSYLLVGVNSDESVEKAKGFRPVLNDRERQIAVSACRFVDDIVPASPYVMTESYIDYLVRDYGIDYFVHGDDPCLVDGKDVYESAKRAGRFCTIPRTEGISTTDIVGRFLLLSQDHHKELLNASSDGVFASQQSNFLVTAKLLRAFAGALPAERQGKGKGKVVYVDGAWDMFHAGHILLLQKARDLGDYLVAGVHSDSVVNQYRGSNYPIMNMQERSLSVLGCGHVDDVLLDAPWHITREMIATLRIDVVVRGKVRDTDFTHCGDPHAVPIAMAIHVELDSTETLSLDEITQRLESRREEVRQRHKMKEIQEQTWYREKHGLDVKV